VCLTSPLIQIALTQSTLQAPRLSGQIRQGGNGFGYIMAKWTKPLAHANNFLWPYEIALCFDAVRRPVVFSGGVEHGSAGGAFAVAEALQPKLYAHFSNARGEWLIPYLARLGEGRR
jgi:hypothetical protein